MTRLLAIGAHLALAMTVSAAPLAPKKPSDLVLLKGGGTACTFAGVAGVVADVRVNPDGTSTPGFTVPDGDVLVLDGIAVGSGGITLEVKLGIAGGTDTAWTVSIDGGKSFQLPGIVVSAGHALCVATAGGFFQIHGYRTKDK
jgi:hypothetical protein